MTTTQLTLAAGSFIPGQWEHVTFSPAGITPIESFPAFDPPTPCFQTLVGSVGGAIVFDVVASDPDAGDVVTLTATGVPSGASFTPALPTQGNPVMSHFDWTPSSGSGGSYLIQLVATDTLGHQTTCDVTLTVHEVALTCPPDVVEVWTNGPPNQILPAHTGFAFWIDTCDPSAVPTYSDTITPGTQPGDPETFVVRVWKLNDACGNSLSCTQTITLLSPSTGGMLDAAPAQCPNVFDLADSTFVFSLTAGAAMDAVDVDLASLRLERVDGIGAKLKSFALVLDDRATPFWGPIGTCDDEGPDGRVDIVLTIQTSLASRAFRLGLVPDGAALAMRLTGRLLDGTPFDLRDVIVVQH